MPSISHYFIITKTCVFFSIPASTTSQIKTNNVVLGKKGKTKKQKQAGFS